MGFTRAQINALSDEELRGYGITDGGEQWKRAVDPAYKALREQQEKALRTPAPEPPRVPLFVVAHALSEDLQTRLGKIIVEGIEAHLKKHAIEPIANLKERVSGLASASVVGEQGSRIQDLESKLEKALEQLQMLTKAFDEATMFTMK